MTVDPASRGYQGHRHLPSTGPARLEAGVILHGVNGVPPSTLGANGDFALRKDGAAGSAIYQKRAGVWVAVA